MLPWKQWSSVILKHRTCVSILDELNIRQGDETEDMKPVLTYTKHTATCLSQHMGTTHVLCQWWESMASASFFIPADLFDETCQGTSLDSAELSSEIFRQMIACQQCLILNSMLTHHPALCLIQGCLFMDTKHNILYCCVTSMTYLIPPQTYLLPQRPYLLCNRLLCNSVTSSILPLIWEKPAQWRFPY